MKKIVSSLFLITSFLSYGDIILDSSNTKPAINEPFNIQVKFLNEDKRDYKIEGIENLQILSKGTQSKYSYINGDKTSEKIDNYTVIASEVKNFPLSVVTDKNSKSNTLNIEVQKESIQNISEDMKIETSIKDRDSFYFGEKIVYEENFLTTVNINSIGYSRAPKFDDFSVKDLSPAILTGNYEQSYFRAPSGKQGLKLGIYRGVLEANSSGEKIINSGQMAVTQSTGRRDFFFEESTPPKYFGGRNIKVNILPLPTNKPSGFQNIVGTPEIDFSWSSDSVNYGQSLLLNVKIFGNANLDGLEKIVTKNLQDFNVYESLKSRDEKIINGKYYGEKNFEIALIPKKNGEVTIPEIAIPYFDTQMKTYKYLVIPSKKINVTGVSNPTINTTPNSNLGIISPATEKKIDNSLEEIKIEFLDSSTKEKNIFDNYLIIGLIIIVIIESGVIFYLLRKNSKKSSSYNLEDLKKAKDDKEFYEAYCSFMKRKYNFSPKVHLEDKLVKLGLSPEFIQINRELENFHYNNSTIDRKNIINRLKKELKNEK